MQQFCPFLVRGCLLSDFSETSEATQLHHLHLHSLFFTCNWHVPQFSLALPTPEFALPAPFLWFHILTITSDSLSFGTSLLNIHVLQLYSLVGNMPSVQKSWSREITGLFIGIVSGGLAPSKCVLSFKRIWIDWWLWSGCGVDVQ